MTGAVRHRRRAGWPAWAAWAGLALLASGLSGCHRPARQPQAKAVTRPQQQRLIVLPDSGIAVQQGSPEAELADFLASDAPAPRTFRLGGAEFDPWASKPNPPTLRRMYVITQILRAYPKTYVTLIGYTDNEGTPEQNLVLARQRVDKLAEILIHGGIRAGRIETIGKGAVDFIGDNATPEGRALNRRIELVVTAK